MKDSRYEEALERAKQGLPIDEVFPKLKESENERIRQCIGLSLTDVDEQRFKDFGTTLKECLAYLEKQKVNTDGDFGRGYNCGYEACLHSHGAEWFEKQEEPRYTKRNALFDKCVENCDPEIMKRVSDEIDARLQKEQKPLTTEETELNSLAFLEQMGYTCIPPGKEQKPAECIPDSVKFEEGFKTGRELGFREGVESVKPIEWSEEDIDKMVETRARKSGATKSEIAFYRAGIEDTLKTIRPSWKPSEDEERLINTSISFLKDFADKGYENAIECIDWLKSKLNGDSGK